MCSITDGKHIIGKAIPKSDAKFKACGAASFAADVRPGRRDTLCGKLLRSPHAHAAIVSVDINKAAALQGVYAVVTGQDVTPERIGRFLQDRTVLARDNVRFIGEPVAAVAAVDEATAMEALSLIQVEYQPLPAVFTPGEALAPDAPVIHEDLASYEDQPPSNCCGNQRNLVVIERGDVEAAFSAADVVVEGTFTTQPVHQGFIEPKACVADVGKDGKVTIWSANKGPFLSRAMIARGLGLPLSKVRVISPAVGGDFGGKGAPTIEPICALLAIRAGRPVKIAFDASEELATNFVRHPGEIHLRVAAARDGRLLGVEGDVVYNCGAYCDGFQGMASSCITLQGPYRVPSVRLRGLSVFTNSIPAGHVRAPGGPQTIFAIESLMDDVARRLGLDPFAIRQLNALKAGDPGADGRGVMGENGLSETIEKAEEYVRRKMSQKRRGQGVGIACGAWHMTLLGMPNKSKCVVKLNEDGSATLFTGLADNGAGQHMALSQVIGEVLGLRTDEVTVVAGDTDLTPFDQGPGGSMGTGRAAHAAAFAAKDVRRQLLALAASKLEANPEDMEVGDRCVYVKGSPERRLTLAALASAALTSPAGAVIGTGSAEREQWLSEAKRFEGMVDEASFCTHAALVEVDRETGHVSVLDYVAVQDVGVALNPLNARGQIEGAVVGGLGYALSEELVVQDGRVANSTYTDYHLPRADTIPHIHSLMVERPSNLGPFGARGIGETSITPVAAVIANAVYDAIGVRIRDLPITPEKVRSALRGDCN